MRSPGNRTLRPFGELRSAFRVLDNKVDRNYDELREQIDSLRQFMLGESVLGRYATAKYEERLAVIEHRLAELEKRN
jgi:hypothetical protein